MTRKVQPAEHKRRIVVGDIHGELDGLKEILRHAELIDENDHRTHIFMKKEEASK